MEGGLVSLLGLTVGLSLRLEFKLELYESRLPGLFGVGLVKFTEFYDNFCEGRAAWPRTTEVQARWVGLLGLATGL